MSKYEPLWIWIGENGKGNFTLTCEEIGEILGFPVDHSFLRYKNELAAFGYRVGKISLKKETVSFEKM